MANYADLAEPFYSKVKLLEKAYVENPKQKAGYNKLRSLLRRHNKGKNN